MNEVTQTALNKHVKVLRDLTNYYDEIYNDLDGGAWRTCGDMTAKIVDTLDTAVGLIEEMLGDS